MIARLVCFAAATVIAAAPAPLKVLIVDGQNNHDWKATTPPLKKMLEATGLFTVEVATTPAKGGDMSVFRPEFKAYRVVVLNYNGDDWPEATRAAFVAYVRGGGGVVAYHAANNAFTQWKEFNEIVALGGWGGRDQTSGPFLRWRDGKAVIEDKPGRAGHHGKQQPFQVVARETKHPILRGLPDKWMHVADELYDSMRGPAKNVTLLATAWSDPANAGTGENEPMLFTVAYGKGRIFHTMLGHGPEAIACTGFQATFTRGAEWAATGKVTQKLPADFPGPSETRTRQP
jgi:type 1 glutamine amidotransferase